SPTERGPKRRRSHRGARLQPFRISRADVVHDGRTRPLLCCGEPVEPLLERSGRAARPARGFDDPARMTAVRGSVWVWAALAVVALALGDCARLVVGAEMAPREADWRAASAFVRAGFATGDLIVAAPGWADPMMRLVLGDLVPVAVAARADA